MIEYYIAMLIFLLVVASMGYFMYEWYEVVQKVNLINSNNVQGIGLDNVKQVQLASLHQPCVTTGGDMSGTMDPICDTSFKLTCVTGMYIGNGDGTNTGVCLSTVGGYCDTIYDCTPSADACINNTCENMSETINLPCVYDSDCIGSATCVDCKTGSGPCKDNNGNCYELVNGQCPADKIDSQDHHIKLTLCNDNSGTYAGEFRYNHICDTSLEQPLCKYNLSPKDQGCTTDSECVQPDGGAICYTGGFKSSINPTGVLTPPSYPIEGIINASNTGVIRIDFGDSLVTINSFEKGTEINFIDSSTVRSAVKYGPYYLLEQYDNNMLSISTTRYQPDIEEYVQFPNNYIELNEDQYSSGTGVNYTDLSNFSNIDIAFGKLPPFQIISKCYVVSSTSNVTTFELVDTTPNFKLINGTSGGKLVNGGNVLEGTTEVRFRINSQSLDVGDINKAPQFTLSTVIDEGNRFTVNGELSYLYTYNSATNSIEVLFGEPIDIDLLNGNKGVCVMKLPPTANVNTDSKYDLTGYSGNPCIQLYDGSVSVFPIDGYCKFQNTPSGPGSVCQFSRTEKDRTYTPLPCGKESTVYEGITYDLECLINDNLTETVRNNPNFLNSSYAGICAYPVHKKFKSCDLYNNNCQPPYVCTEFEGGYFCDSRFDVLQCNSVYACPPTFGCVDGICLSNPGGYCVDKDNCTSIQCNKNKLVLTFYNSTIDTKTSVPTAEITGNVFNDSNIPNQLVQLPVDLSDISGIDASGYDLYVSSTYETDNSLTTYAFIYSKSKSKLVKITDVLGKPKVSDQVCDPKSYTKFTFDHTNQNLYGYTISPSFSLECIFSPGTKPLLQPPSSYPVNNVIDIDIDNDRLLVTSKNTIASSRPQFINLDLPSPGNTQINEYNVTLFDDITITTSTKSYVLPYYSEELDDLTNCRFDLLNVNDTELDIVCTYNPEDFDSPVLGVRNKVRSINNNYFSSLFETIPISSGELGSFKLPTISDLKAISDTAATNVGISDSNVYVINNASDINTIYAFSNKAMTIGDENVTKIYKQKSSLYLVLSDSISDKITSLESTTNFANGDDVTVTLNSDSTKTTTGTFNSTTSTVLITGSTTDFANGNSVTVTNNTIITTTGTFNSSIVTNLVSTTNFTDGDSVTVTLTSDTTKKTIGTFNSSTSNIVNLADTTNFTNGVSVTVTLIPEKISGTFESGQSKPYTLSTSLGNYAPFSFSSTSNLDNYGNVLSTYLEYPYWISDLQDLVVGDNFKPQIKRIFYQPDRVNKNFYAIVDMYTGYDNPVENKILETDTNLQNNNMYLFKFSSLNNEFALTVNETLPIRVFGPDDVRRFSQCNQTQNMFFLSNICN